jgi:hypothetical protein
LDDQQQFLLNLVDIWWVYFSNLIDQGRLLLNSVNQWYPCLSNLVGPPYYWGWFHPFQADMHPSKRNHVVSHPIQSIDEPMHWFKWYPPLGLMLSLEMFPFTWIPLQHVEFLFVTMALVSWWLLLMASMVCKVSFSLCSLGAKSSIGSFLSSFVYSNVV